MRAVELLCEGKIFLFDRVKVIQNPNIHQLKTLVKNRKDDSLRVLLTKTDFYIWDSWELTHRDVIVDLAYEYGYEYDNDSYEHLFFDDKFKSTADPRYNKRYTKLINQLKQELRTRNLTEATLLEYKLFKHDKNFKIYMNPSAKDIRTILKNSYVLSIDLNSPDQKRRQLPWEYPLRGLVIDGDVYIVDSYYASHFDLIKTLRNQGMDIELNTVAKITIEKSTARGDEGYMIGTPSYNVYDLESIPAVIRMKMPVGIWK